jgi:succinylglutamate desuccinylase
MSEKINTVAITGGTHGNELTGVYLVKHWQSQPEEVQRSSFATETYVANLEALQQIRRYVDQDLNRQFTLEDLNNSNLDGCEQRRAKVLNETLGPKENPRVDFILDLHTTTANMGMSLICNSDNPLELGMAFYIKQKMPDAILFYEPSDRMENNFLASLGRFGGLVVEVGPIPQGLLNYEVYADTRTAVLHALDYVELINTGQKVDLPSQMEGYSFVEKLPLPLNEHGEISAMVHPDRQNQDYKVINPGDPLFITLAGETISYEGDEPVFGAFINEAAYYDRKVGLSLMKKIVLKLDTNQ